MDINLSPSVVLALVCGVLLSAAIVSLFFFLLRSSPSEASDAKSAAEDAGRGRARRAMDRMMNDRRERGRNRLPRNAAEAEQNEAAGDEVEGADAVEAEAPALRLRQTMKDAKKEEKRRRKESEQQQREQRQRATKEKEMSFRQKQEEREKQRELRELEEKKEEEERQRRDEEEYQKWKSMISVDQEGEDVVTVNQMKCLLNQFVSYIKLRKVVMLEDLAAEFQLKTQDAVNRLRDLEKMGRINGVFDDRGKYIYITEDEMQSLTEYMKKKGRITKSGDLVAACNRLIRLAPSAEDKAKIMEENKHAMELLSFDIDDSNRLDQNEITS